MRRAIALLYLIGTLAMAEPGNEAEPAKLSVSAETLKEFQAIEALAAKSAYADAERKIRELLPQQSGNPGLQALLLRNLASLYGLQKHYLHAAETLQQSLALQALPAKEAVKAQQELGQYYLAAGNDAKAAEALTAWIGAAPAPAPEDYLMLAEIRTRLKQYPEAVALAEKAVAGSPQPKPAWRQLLAGLYYQTRNLDGCAAMLAEMIAAEPDKLPYWNQLAGIYQEAGKPMHALAVRQVMHKKNLLGSPQELLQLAQLLRYHGMPSRAAELLQEEIDKRRVAATAPHFELLADAWTDARELQKAAAAMERAISMAGTGNAYLRLGQIYSELKDWSKAKSALTQALARADLKNAGSANLLLGLAQYKLNAKEQARDAFLKAQRTPSVAKTAQQWLEHLDKEKAQN